MDTGLRAKTVVVTGATANIGRGVALAFADEGARVVVVGRDDAQGERVVADARARGATDACFVRTDVLDRAQVADLVQRVEERNGGIDVLVNNVGGNVDVRAFVDTTPEDWAFDIAINLTSTLECTHAVLPGMIARNGGRIVNIGSTAGFVGDRNLAVYSAAKGAVHTFTKVLAKEVGEHGITVNCVAPYGTLPEDADRELSSGSRFHPDGVFARVLAERPEQMAAMAQPTVLGRPTAVPSEIGAAVVYLASAGAAFVTGQVLAVDGGMLIA